MLMAKSLLIIIAVSTLSGCASPQMKGTPFYSGEYASPGGDPADRIAAWPLLYYREPVLSVLWPLFEMTDEHMAIRPIMSVYGRGKDQKVFNFLWPLGRYDQRHDTGRFFPYFWGKDYNVVFPLYWSYVTKYGNGDSKGLNAFFPLWSYSWNRDKYSVHAMWPIFNVKDNRESRGWRFWPLYGQYADSYDYYRFQCWPLFHQWGSVKRADDYSNMMLPLYYFSADGDEKDFISLLYGRRVESPKRGSEYLMPLYYRDWSLAENNFFSLLYMHGIRSENDYWRLAVPFFWSSRDGNNRSLFTLLGGMNRSADSLTYVLPPLLSWGTVSDTETNRVYLAGLGGSKKQGEFSSDYIFPFYFRERDEEGSRFFSPLWFKGEDKDGTDWSALLPLYYKSSGPGEEFFFTTLLGGYRSDGEGRNWLVYPLLSSYETGDEGSDLWVLGPLFHSGRDGDKVQQHLFPAYYRNSESGTFLSLFFSKWRGGNGSSSHLYPLLLSLSQRSPERSTLYTAAGLARFSDGEEALSDYIFPLFYRSADKNCLVTPLFAKWGKSGGAGSEGIAIPPLLSWFAKEGDDKSFTAFLGLGREKWNGDKRSGYLFPLYYHDSDGVLITPLFGWDKESSDGFVYPFTPLAGWYRGGNSGGWLFPLFSKKKNKRSGNVTGCFLWGTYSNSKRRARSSLFPLYSYDRVGSYGDDELGPGLESAFSAKKFYCIPFCWYENYCSLSRDKSSKEVLKSYRKKHGIFPLYSSRSWSDFGGKNKTRSGSLLMFLYDYKSKHVAADPAVGKAAYDYSRSRILWRMWHSERTNDEVSTDIFPAITYDRKGSEFKKVSFLWRFFRYERRGSGKKIDLLFIPVYRSKG